ncbi:sulfatase family protein [Aquimarina algicola]|uniref:Sulfatase n=1 Tax=Aquimarina algicola TaxID=2589995 RepID=A0A504J4U5_9FLAO|nr:sulfatase [Aquimarina algicola]TPN81191.1 sulfatase [Aquimarina algicola]
MKLRIFILSILFLGVIFVSFKTSEENFNKDKNNNTLVKKQPNLIIIHTDEHNFRTLSCYQELMSEDQAFVWGKGNNATTPNIDRIADEGAIATSYYCSSPVCTPSRASLVTGLYPQATGAPKNGMPIREDIPTFATILKAQGYATSYVGKWHLAGGHEKYKFNIKYKAGFDDNRYMMTGGHTPYYQFTKDGIREININKAKGVPQDEIIHATDYFTDKTLEILERDKDKPFALMLSIPDPHTPDHARPPYDKMYEGLDIKAPKTMEEKYVKMRPSWATGKTNNEAVGKKSFINEKNALKQYFGMVSHIDDSVGRILKFLDDNNLTENTIIVFTSDHGDLFFEHNRRNKGMPYEASAKIPFVIRYPNKIMAGKVINTAYNNIDFTPTILSLMDIKTDVKFHGLDTSHDYISTEKVVNSDRITYFARTGGQWVCAVSDRYKLVIDKDEKPYLFDLKKDPDEIVNFYYDKAYATIAKEMQNELFKQLKKYDEPGLKNNKAYIIK